MDADTIYHFTLTCLKPKGLGYPKEPKTLGEHIRKKRMDLKLLQTEAAERLGITAAGLQVWEQDKAEPLARYIPAILAFVGYDPRSKPSEIGALLIWFRRGRGWTQFRLARELQVDQSTLARWESGKKKPWGPYLERVNALLLHTS